MVAIKKGSYFFVSDSNTFIAVSLGISSFLYFKNIKMKYSRFINNIGATTFGIFLIHTNSDTMRRWLWKDTLNVAGFYKTNSIGAVMLHAILSVVIIFIICMIIDEIRIKFLEKPLFHYMERYEWLNRRIE